MLRASTLLAIVAALTLIGNLGRSATAQGTPTSAQDIPPVLELIRETAHVLAEDPAWHDRILEDPVVAGVESVTGAAVTIRVIVKCTPNDHYAVQRELRERTKEAFDREGIHVPVPTPAPPAPPSAGT